MNALHEHTVKLAVSDQVAVVVEREKEAVMVAFRHLPQRSHESQHGEILLCEAVWL
jgi:hypothetical protein